jgi:hypothetical protein
MYLSCWHEASFFTIIPIFLGSARKQRSLLSYSPSPVGVIALLSKDASFGFLTHPTIPPLTSRTSSQAFLQRDHAFRRII